MVNNIRICPDGHIIPDSDCLGRTGEHNATVLQFSFFDKLNGEDMSDFEKYLVAELPEGNFPLAIDGDFLVPNILTCNTELPMFVEIRKGESVLFRSYPHIFTFADTGGNSENDAIGMAMDSAREERRQELSAILAMATGEPQDGKTWDELKEVVFDVAGQVSLIEEMINESGVIEYDSSFDGWNDN